MNAQRVDCPTCGSPGGLDFYEQHDVPASSCVLLDNRHDALNCRKGNITLRLCSACGLVWNRDFDFHKTEYSERYEETQAFSPHFSAYLDDLVGALIQKYELRNKTVIEIGCGKGEFLARLCEVGQNRGYGFDPSFSEQRNPSPARNDVVYSTDIYGPDHVGLHADFYCCRMTLEHIPRVGAFLSMLHSNIGDKHDAIVYFQVPNAEMVLSNGMFCDVLYEHCNYLTSESLRNAFRMAGFDPLSTYVSFSGQHINIEAKRVTEPVLIEPIQDLETQCRMFQTRCHEQIETWNESLERSSAKGSRTVIWGSGSKATTFLNSLRAPRAISYVVDINPFRWSHFMAGTGHLIRPPGDLVAERPDNIIVMNPIYLNEVNSELSRLDCSSRVMPLLTPCLNETMAARRSALSR